MSLDIEVDLLTQFVSKILHDEVEIRSRLAKVRRDWAVRDFSFPYELYNGMAIFLQQYILL